MQNQELQGAKKVFNTIISIVILVMLLISLVGVWGDVLSTYTGISTQNFHIGLNYFIYDGWKNASAISSEYNNALVTAGVYLTLIVTILAFIASVAVVYIFGIKGIVEGLRGLIAKKTVHITKNAVIVYLTLFAYHLVARLCVFNAYGPGIFDGTLHLSTDLGWGSALCGVFGYSGMFFTLVYLVIEKFDTKQVAKSIRNILFAVSTLFLLSVISLAATDAFGYTRYSSSDGLGIINTFILLSGVPLSPETSVFVTISTILLIVVTCGAILLLIQIIKHFFFGKELNKKLVVVFSAITAATALLAMILGNPAVESLVKDVTNSFSYNFIEVNSLSGVFSSSLIVLVLSITSVFLNENKVDEVEPLEDNRESIN